MAKEKSLSSEVEKAMRPYLLALRDQGVAQRKVLEEIVSLAHPTEEAVLQLPNGQQFIIRGVEGKPGTDGATPKHGVDYFTDEEVAFIVKCATPKYGRDYMTKKQIAEFLEKATPKKGVHYKDGETPKKGADYFTKSDVQNIIEQVLATVTPMIEKERRLDPVAVRNAIESLRGNSRLSASSLKDIEKTVPRQMSPIAGGNGSNGRDLVTITTSGVVGAQAIKKTDFFYVMSSGVLTLPSVSGLDSSYTVKNIGTGVVVNASAGQLIDGNASLSLQTKYVSVTLISDGTGWNIT